MAHAKTLEMPSAWRETIFQMSLFAIGVPFGYIFQYQFPIHIAMKQKPTLYLLDGMALAYRSYFAFIRNPLMNSKGENTSAVFGFVNYLNKILDEKKPDYIAVVFDTIEPTFRHKAYPEYKATRQKMPEDMSAMMDTLKEVVRAFNVPVVELPASKQTMLSAHLPNELKRKMSKRSLSPAIRISCSSFRLR
jgi:5'-3' exonuclease